MQYRHAREKVVRSRLASADVGSGGAARHSCCSHRCTVLSGGERGSCSSSASGRASSRSAASEETSSSQPCCTKHSTRASSAGADATGGLSDETDADTTGGLSDDCCGADPGCDGADPGCVLLIDGGCDGGRRHMARGSLTSVPACVCTCTCMCVYVYVYAYGTGQPDERTAQWEHRIARCLGADEGGVDLSVRRGRGRQCAPHTQELGEARGGRRAGAAAAALSRCPVPHKLRELTKPAHGGGRRRRAPFEQCTERRLAQREPRLSRQGRHVQVRAARLLISGRLS